MAQCSLSSTPLPLKKTLLCVEQFVKGIHVKLMLPIINFGRNVFSRKSKDHVLSLSHSYNTLPPTSLIELHH